MCNYICAYAYNQNKINDFAVRLINIIRVAK